MMERIYTNIGSPEDYVQALRYFDAMSEDFYIHMFDMIDEITFRSTELQELLYLTLTTPHTFKLFNNIHYKDDIIEYGDMIKIRFVLGDGCITFLSIKTPNNEFTRGDA